MTTVLIVHDLAKRFETTAELGHALAARTVIVEESIVVNETSRADSQHESTTSEARHRGGATGQDLRMSKRERRHQDPQVHAEGR